MEGLEDVVERIIPELALSGENGESPFFNLPPLLIYY